MKRVCASDRGGEPAVPGQERFPRRERLSKRREFLHVYEAGTKVVARPFICFVVRQPGQGRKFGMAVPRRVGGAVVRNRVKRYLREIYRTRRKNLVDDCAIVIVAQKEAAQLSYQACAETIAKLFRKGGLMSE